MIGNSGSTFTGGTLGIGKFLLGGVQRLSRSNLLGRSLGLLTRLALVVTLLSLVVTLLAFIVALLALVVTLLTLVVTLLTLVVTLLTLVAPLLPLGFAFTLTLSILTLWILTLRVLSLGLVSLTLLGLSIGLGQLVQQIALLGDVVTGTLLLFGKCHQGFGDVLVASTCAAKRQHWQQHAPVRLHPLLRLGSLLRSWLRIGCSLLSCVLGRAECRIGARINGGDFLGQLTRSSASPANCWASSRPSGLQWLV